MGFIRGTFLAVPGFEVLLCLGLCKCKGEDVAGEQQVLSYLLLSDEY